MFEYTLNNHHIYGLENELYTYSPDLTKHKKWFCKYGKCSYVPDADYKEECIKTAWLIKKNNPDELLNVYFSGGLDSEVVIESFNHAKIPITISILKLADDLNKHDIDYAINYCQERNLKYTIFELDFNWFIQSGNAKKYADLYRCPSFVGLGLMWTLDRMPGFPIIGAGDFFHKLEHIDDKLFIAEFENRLSIQSYLIRAKKKGIGLFFKYNPENILSYLSMPIVKSIYEKNISIDDCTKHDFYKEYFKDILIRPKYHGFEKVTIPRDVWDYVKDTYVGYNCEYRVLYDDVIESLTM